MSCFLKKITLIGSFILCLGFVSVLSFSSSYATSDISVTIPSNTSVSQWSDLFSSCTGDCLNDYSYLIVSGSPYDISNSQRYLNLYIRWNGSMGHIFTISGNSSFSIYKLPFNGSSNNYLQWGNNFSFENELTFTLTDSYASCPEPEEPDCPPSETPYDDKLDQLTRAIYIVPATLIVLYFFYCMYRLIIKTTGVN